MSFKPRKFKTIKQTGGKSGDLVRIISTGETGVISHFMPAYFSMHAFVRIDGAPINAKGLSFGKKIYLDDLVKLKVRK